MVNFLLPRRGLQVFFHPGPNDRGRRTGYEPFRSTIMFVSPRFTRVNLMYLAGGRIYDAASVRFWNGISELDSTVRYCEIAYRARQPMGDLERKQINVVAQEAAAQWEVDGTPGLKQLRDELPGMIEQLGITPYPSEE